MVWLALSHIFSAILELIHIGRLSDKDKDLEIMILRHQLHVMTRLQPPVPCKYLIQAAIYP